MRYARRYAAVAVLLLLFTGGYAGTLAWQPAASDPVRAEHGMVVSAQDEASRAGVEVLEAGGNAVDAAVATGFALAVVHPSAGNIGGGGFMVIRLADGTATTIDFRERAPLAASRDMYLDSTGAADPTLSRVGYLASGVPGSVAGLIKAHDEYGSLPLKEVMAPAIRLAEKGFVLSYRQARSLNGMYPLFAEYPSTKKYFTKGDSTRFFEEGDRFVQKDLADVLKRIRKEGRDGFYEGKVADLIVDQMQRGGGLITKEDLEAYEAVERKAVEGTYRGYHVLSMPPPSSGGVAVVQLLNAVEPYDLGAMGYHASATIHLMGEAMRRVYADRAQWLGDSDFFNVPLRQLIDKNYMRQRMVDFNPYRADTSANVTYGDPFANESTETTHYSVVDQDGNAVAVTTTLNGGYGSRVAVDGAGFLLNNEMDDFSAKPGVPNMYGLVGSEANAIEPGKRMLSSMSPTIVTDPDGRLFMVVGSPGGSTIITTVFQTIVDAVDYGMNIQEAVAAPRIHHQWLPDVLIYEDYALPQDVVLNLERRGWNVSERGEWGRADGIMVRYEPVHEGAATDGTGAPANRAVYYGGADPRGEDAAIGY